MQDWGALLLKTSPLLLAEPLAGFTLNQHLVSHYLRRACTDLCFCLLSGNNAFVSLRGVHWAWGQRLFGLEARFKRGKSTRCSHYLLQLPRRPPPIIFSVNYSWDKKLLLWSFYPFLFTLISGKTCALCTSRNQHLTDCCGSSCGDSVSGVNQSSLI